MLPINRQEVRSVKNIDQFCALWLILGFDFSYKNKLKNYTHFKNHFNESDIDVSDFKNGLRKDDTHNLESKINLKIQNFE